MNTYSIWQCIDDPLSRPMFRILETYKCAEGHRTRVCMSWYSTKEEAEYWVEKFKLRETTND